MWLWLRLLSYLVRVTRIDRVTWLRGYVVTQVFEEDVSHQQSPLVMQLRGYTM